MDTAKGSASRRALVLSAPAALLLAACGPAPGATYAEAGAPPGASARGETVYVILAERGAPAEDAWEPEETHGENPFGKNRTWVGDYDCPQGNTALTLQVIQVRGPAVTAVFEFHHVESDVAGKFLMNGRYDGETRRITFNPGAWLVHPPHYTAVPMSGDVASDGSLFAGRIDHPQCGAFRLRPAK